MKPFFTYGYLIILALFLICPVQAEKAGNGVKKASVNLNKEAEEKNTPDAATEKVQYLINHKYAPPLSIYESIRLIENINELLDTKVKKFEGPRREKATTLIKLVRNHVKLTDDRSSSLLFYRWYYLGRHKVKDETIEEDIFKVEPPVKNVSAISFEAKYADVKIHYMKVIAVDGKETDFKINKWITAGLPRQELCFFYFPTTIKKVILDYSTRPDSRARLRLYAGVTDTPEYCKAALYYLTEAQKDLERSSFTPSIKNLEKARTQLIHFQRQKKL
jgi:hypothetical protein